MASCRDFCEGGGEVIAGRCAAISGSCRNAWQNRRSTLKTVLAQITARAGPARMTAATALSLVPAADCQSRAGRMPKNMPLTSFALKRKAGNATAAGNVVGAA